MCSEYRKSVLIDLAGKLGMDVGVRMTQSLPRRVRS